MLLYSELGGFHNFSDSEVEGALKDGWEIGEPIRQKLLDAKRAKIAEPATLPAQDVIKRSPGRPRNVMSSILNDREQ